MLGKIMYSILMVVTITGLSYWFVKGKGIGLLIFYYHVCSDSVRLKMNLLGIKVRILEFLWVL